MTCLDRLIRSDRQRQLAVALGAQLIEIEGAHNVWLVRPKEFAAAVDQGLEYVFSRQSRVPLPNRLTDLSGASPLA